MMTMTSARARITASLAVALVEQAAVQDAAQRRGNREAGEIRPGGLEQEAENVAQCALKRGGNRPEQHGCRRESQVRQRNFQAVIQLDDAVGGKHHLNGEKHARHGQRLRAAQGMKGIGKLFQQTGKNTWHKKHLRVSVRAPKGRSDSQR